MNFVCIFHTKWWFLSFFFFFWSSCLPFHHELLILSLWISSVVKSFALVHLCTLRTCIIVIQMHFFYLCHQNSNSFACFFSLLLYSMYFISGKCSFLFKYEQWPHTYFFRAKIKWFGTALAKLFIVNLWREIRFFFHTVLYTFDIVFLHICTRIPIMVVNF